MPVVQEVPTLDDTARTGGFGSTNISFISIDQLLQTQQEEDQYYLCSITEAGDVTYTNARDPRIKPTLEEFPDIFPDELPPGLPPSRDIVMLNLLPVNYATFNLNHNTATVSLSERSSSTWGQLYMLKISWFKGRSELWNRSARNKCIRPDRVVNL